jgi:hypothetical protein
MTRERAPVLRLAFRRISMMRSLDFSIGRIRLNEIMSMANKNVAVILDPKFGAKLNELASSQFGSATEGGRAPVDWEDAAAGLGHDLRLGRHYIKDRSPSRCSGLA